MKKIVLILSVLLTLSACKNTNQELVGVWQVSEVDLSAFYESLDQNETDALQHTFELIEQSYKSMVFTFDKDGTITVVSDIENTKGTWNYNQNKQTITIEVENDETLILEINTLSNSELKFTTNLETHVPISLTLNKK